MARSQKTAEGNHMAMALQQTFSHIARAALIFSIPMLTACDDESLMPPTPAAGAMFARYVAIGNSITAGFQSGGINDSTQEESYAVLLARQFGLELDVEFNIPRLAFPGCPPPLVNIFTLELIAIVPGGCALRARPIPTFINNVAVPGAAVIDVLSNLDDDSDANALTTFMLGGRTQLEVAREVDPTFVSVWIGNNDVLGAALAGDASLVTATASFADRYDSMVDSLLAMGIEGAVLIGVVNVTVIPHLSAGVAYWLVAQMPGAFPPTFTVNNNCGPAVLGGVGESTLVPFGYGFGVLIAQASVGVPTELDCVNDAPVLTGAELVTIGGAVLAYNQTISAAATAQGWAYVDPNPTLDSLVQAGEVPLFPNATGLDAVTRPFGDFFSRDGFHPNVATHNLVADHVIDAINATYGTTIAQP